MEKKTEKSQEESRIGPADFPKDMLELCESEQSVEEMIKSRLEKSAKEVKGCKDNPVTAEEIESLRRYSQDIFAYAWNSPWNKSPYSLLRLIMMLCDTFVW